MRVDWLQKMKLVCCAGGGRGGVAEQLRDGKKERPARDNGNVERKI